MDTERTNNTLRKKTNGQLVFYGAIFRLSQRAINIVIHMKRITYDDVGQIEKDVQEGG